VLANGCHRRIEKGRQDGSITFDHQTNDELKRGEKLRCTSCTAIVQGGAHRQGVAPRSTPASASCALKGQRGQALGGCRVPRDPTKVVEHAASCSARVVLKLAWRAACHIRCRGDGKVQDPIATTATSEAGKRATCSHPSHQSPSRGPVFKCTRGSGTASRAGETSRSSATAATSGCTTTRRDVHGDGAKGSPTPRHGCSRRFVQRCHPSWRRRIRRLVPRREKRRGAAELRGVQGTVRPDARRLGRSPAPWSPTWSGSWRPEGRRSVRRHRSTAGARADAQANLNFRGRARGAQHRVRLKSSGGPTVTPPSSWRGRRAAAKPAILAPVGYCAPCALRVMPVGQVFFREMELQFPTRCT